jgi:hypothetical protein
LCSIKEANGEMAIKARVLLVNKQDKSDGSAEKFGTYGMISGASYFIVGIVDKDEKNALKFGYLFEKIVLFATDLGLQTNSLGGLLRIKADINFPFVEQKAMEWRILIYKKMI